MGESFTWPSDLAETREFIDWSTLSISDDGPARQAAYTSWRESTQGMQKSRSSITGFLPLPTQLSEYQEQLWTKYGGDEVEPLLSSGAVVLVDAHWLIAFYERGGRALGRRQDLPIEAFITLPEIKASGAPLESLPIIMESYMWLQPDHPDPRGHNLTQTVFMLKALTCQRPQQLRNFGASTYGPGYTQRFGVFVDWLSMHQKPRSQEEDGWFGTALDNLGHLYSHPHTIVIRCTKLPVDYPKGYILPDNANRAEYADRGWPFTETAWSSLIKSRNQNFDLGMLSGMAWPMLHSIHEVCTKGVRTMPLLPEEFNAALEVKRFTNGKEDHPRCSELYRKAFDHRLGSATILKLNSLNFGDSDMAQLARVIATQVFKFVRSLVLHSNNISAPGIQVLAASIKTSTLPKLQYMYLGGNMIGDEGAEAIASMLANGNVPLLKELDVRDSQIGPKGLHALADAIASGAVPYLETVSCKKNPGDDKHVQEAVANLNAQQE